MLSKNLMAHCLNTSQLIALWYSGIFAERNYELLRNINLDSSKIRNEDILRDKAMIRSNNSTFFCMLVQLNPKSQIFPSI